MDPDEFDSVAAVVTWVDRCEKFLDALCEHAGAPGAGPLPAALYAEARELKAALGEPDESNRHDA